MIVGWEIFPPLYFPHAFFPQVKFLLFPRVFHVSPLCDSEAEGHLILPIQLGKEVIIPADKFKETFFKDFETNNTMLSEWLYAKIGKYIDFKWHRLISLFHSVCHSKMVL